jgi:hypothetical protein
MFDLEDYVVARDDEPEARHQLLVGLTHSVLMPNDSTEHGRVFVESGTVNTTEHWILRPSFRPPTHGGPDMIVRALPGTATLADLFRWARETPGSVYIRAGCTELPVPLV